VRITFRAGSGLVRSVGDLARNDETKAQSKSRWTMGKITILPSLFPLTDEQAMWRVATQGDHRAFAQLVERWQQPIHRLCARMTGDPHRGEDLKQETFARVFEKRDSYQPAMPFSTWLWRIALNLCYDELRRVKRRAESPLEPEENGQQEYPAVTPGPDTRLAGLEEGELVRRAVLQLPDIYRSVLVLRFYENLKFRQIAEVLEIPEGTVHSRLVEGIIQLTRILEPQLGEGMPSVNQVKSRSVGPSRSQPGSNTEPPTTAVMACLAASWEKKRKVEL
jgi:RNA polymerase sigma-70 factor, ECF subfamily